MSGVLFTLAGAVAHQVWRSPVIAFWAFLVISAALTRLFTGIRYHIISRDFSRHSTSIPTAPYWIPWLGHTLPFVLNSHKWLSGLSLKVRHGIFTTVLGGKRCHMVMSPGLAKQVLSAQAPVGNDDLVASFMRNVWDDKGAFGAIMGNAALWAKLHRAIHQLNREPFVTQSGDIVTANIEATVLGLVSPPSAAGSPLPSWQKQANVVISLRPDSRAPAPAGPVVEAEASLFPLIRHYVADMVLPAIFGTDFMRNYPDCASGAFAFDESFYLFLVGLPAWVPHAGMRQSAAARARIKAALADLHGAIAASLRGETPSSGSSSGGDRWANLHDVSSVMVERVRAWEEGGGPARAAAYTAAHAFLFWGALVNANVVVFWLLFHIYRDPALLADVRREIAPFATVRMMHSDSSGPGGMLATFKLDPRGIRRATPLLQSAFLETMRLYTKSTVLKTVQQDFDITESAAPGPYTPGRTYRLRRGDMVCVPFGVHHADPRYHDDPHVFNPRRFLVFSEDPSKGGGDGARCAADYTRIHPWGMGPAGCKGQKFSQREVLEFAASILMCWDVEPVDKVAGWSHPGLKMAGGTAAPKEDVRVILRRRVPG